MNIKLLKNKVNDFLGLQRKDNDLIEIIQYFQDSIRSNTGISSCLLAVEHVFTELLKRNEMYIEVKPLKPRVVDSQSQYREWLQDRYKEVFRGIISCLNATKHSDAIQALSTAMTLIGYEGKYPIDNTNEKLFPTMKLRTILIQLLSTEKSMHHVLLHLKEYSINLDVIFYIWKFVPGLTLRGTTPGDIYIQNYIDLLKAIPLTTEIQEAKRYLCGGVMGAGGNEHGGNNNNNNNSGGFNDGHSNGINTQNGQFDYNLLRKYISNSFSCAIFWTFTPTLMKRFLIVLLENILHMEKPLILTDFLMDALDVGGPISLLALQAVFILVQRDNLTYTIYEKLYSMFEPEIFHTKYKSRLYCLADIFLSSSHIPENLIAAFIKRLARLTLIVQPQDIVIILQFIGTLIGNHPGLKRLLNNTSLSHANDKIACDPYVMDECNPYKSGAMESSLWELLTLQNHVIPSVAETAKFILNPKPHINWELGKYIELNENDIFDQEMMRQTDKCDLNPNPRQKLTEYHLDGKDSFKLYWKLF